MHHILHDYSELLSAYKEIERCHTPPLNRHSLYSFIAHYRKFAVFFSNPGNRGARERRRKRGEMHASDFTNKALRYDLREWRRWENHMNTHFFHLNLFRTENTRPWTGHQEVPRMMQQMDVAWKLFVANLKEPWLSEYSDEMALRASA